jgi:hypothetical protein
LSLLGTSRCGERCIRRSGCSPGDDGRRGWAEVRADVISPPPVMLCSKTNDNPIAILLSHGTVRVLLPGDDETREEEYMASGSYARP